MGIGKRIESIAKKRGVSIRKVSAMADIPYNTLYAVVKRDGSTNIENIGKLASALDVSPWDLLGISQDVGGRIADVRKEAGMSQDDLASRLGVSLIEVQSWEKNEVVPSNETLKSIAESVDIDFSYFSEVLTGADKAKTDNALERLETAYYRLNASGKEAAAERVEELTMIPKYQAGKE